MRTLLAYYADAVMAAGGAGCADCNHRGDCMNGTCLCEIRFTGDKCDGPNMSYHGAIGGMFLVVAFVCAVQLTMCIVAEYQRLKGRTLLRACKVTTQKMLYLVTFLAALIRGAYFVSPSSFHEGWTRSLLSAYYPLLMSGSSLIVCFWAEVFHLRDIRWERPRFLSKSFLAFVTFNVINFSLLGAQVLTTFAADSSEQNQTFYQHVFYGCYAVLLLIVVIFFLIYGVEVYFKLHGQFLKVTKVCDVKATRAGPSTAADGDDVQDTLVTKQGIQTDLAEPDGSVDPRSVNTSQLHQSRLGLVSQALMLTLIAAFLVSEILSEFWKAKVPVGSRNWHDVVFRLAEIGVAVWFPCVLWNCMAPETLWLLNPRRLLARQLDDARLARLAAGPRDIKRLYSQSVLEFGQLCWHERLRLLLTVARCWAVSLSTLILCMFLNLYSVKPNLETDSLVESVGLVRECWICYDTSSPEPLIKPCRCTGDVSAVHHDCLVRWLVESASTPDGLKCKICSTPYSVQQTNKVEWERGFTAWHWVQTALVVVSMCGAVAGAVGVIQVFPGPVPLVLAGGGAMLYCYVAFTKLSGNTVMAYQRAKVFSIKILADRYDGGPGQTQLATISKTVTVEIASKAILEQALKGDMK